MGHEGTASGGKDHFLQKALRLIGDIIPKC